MKIVFYLHAQKIDLRRSVTQVKSQIISPKHFKFLQVQQNVFSMNVKKCKWILLTCSSTRNLEEKKFYLLEETKQAKQT